MQKITFILVFCSTFCFGQVGINTTDPKGALDITSSNLGLVLPRVTQLEDVTNNNSGLAEDGTIVYDVSRSKTCFRISSTWICIANDASLAITSTGPFTSNGSNNKSTKTRRDLKEEEEKYSTTDKLSKSQ